MKRVLTQSEEDRKLFFEDREKRALRYPGFETRVRSDGIQYREMAQCFRRDGSLLLRGFFPRERMLELGRRFEDFVRSERCLTPIKNRAKKYMDPEASEKLPLRDRASSVGLEDPLVNLPDLVELAFDPRILGVATAYFETVPMLSFVKVRKAFANSIPASPTQHFHVDIGTYRLFKALVYLNDVGPGGGPFCYVRGTHREKFPDWDSKRYTHEEMAAIRGEDQVIRWHAAAGDLIFAESTGFHRGEKPSSQDRRVLIFNYTVHPEYGFDYRRTRIRRSDFENLPEYARAVADGLEITG